MTTLRLQRLDRLKKTHTNKRKRNGASDSDVKLSLCQTSSSSFFFLFCRLCRGEQLETGSPGSRKREKERNKESTRVWSSAFSSAGVVHVTSCNNQTHRRSTRVQLSTETSWREPTRPPSLPSAPVSLSQGGRSSEVGQELEAQAHHKVPDVSGHLGPGDENPPEDHRQDGVEGVTDVPQPGRTDGDTAVTAQSGTLG